MYNYLSSSGHDARTTMGDAAYYLDDVFDPKSVLKSFKGQVHDQNIRYDTLVGSGLSGALIVPFLATALHKHWAIVRKSDDVSSHSRRKIEGHIGRRWVFVDDLVSSGATRRRVMDAVQELSESHDFKTTFVGSFLYNYGTFRPADDPWG